MVLLQLQLQFKYLCVDNICQKHLFDNNKRAYMCHNEYGLVCYSIVWLATATIVLNIFDLTFKTCQKQLFLIIVKAFVLTAFILILCINSFPISTIFNVLSNCLKTVKNNDKSTSLIKIYTYLDCINLYLFFNHAHCNFKCS